MTVRKYDELISYTRDLSNEQKDTLNAYYEKTFEIIGIRYDSHPLLLKQLSVYIVKHLWEKYGIDQIENLIDEWIHYYNEGFVNYKNSFDMVSDDFDLHITFAIKFIKEKAP